MRTKFLFKSIAVVGLMLTSACATAIKGTTEDVVFKSDPSGARVSTTNGFSCTTPCTIRMDRDDEFVATFKLAGLEKRVTVGTDYADGSAAAIAGTVLFAPLLIAPIGLAVDAASGANLTHVPNPVAVSFPQLKSGTLASAAGAARQTSSAGTAAGTSPRQPVTRQTDPTQTAPSATVSSEAVEVAAATRAALEYPPVPGSPPLFEGSSYAAFMPEQIKTYCGQAWTTRLSASGRTEYNPCSQRSAFR